MAEFAPEQCHDPLLDNAPLKLRFDPAADFNDWRARLNEKVRELLGTMPTPAEDLNIRLGEVIEHDDSTETRFVFTAEAGADVPAALVTPKGEDPWPLLICLQGHGPGMHWSLGYDEPDGTNREAIRGDRDFAVRAAREGWAGLAIEQRCFGLREDRREGDQVTRFQDRCTHASMVALLLGRTMVGERVFDTMRAIDAAGAQFGDRLDMDRVAVMGSSGGGTVAYFAAAVEPRIQAVMPSAYVCTFRDSIAKVDHCTCNYIPHLMEWIEMGDLAGLIAPRPMVVTIGKDDPIFPAEATRREFEQIKRIYAAAGAPDKCALVLGHAGHRFYADDAWPLLHTLTGW